MPARNPERSPARSWVRIPPRHPIRRPIRHPIRKAFSLFEVMIAMAICVAGLALILQMLGTSETLSRRAELHLKAQQHCRNLLSLYQAGIQEPVDTRREELQTDPQFWYSVKLQKHGLLALETIVVDVWPKSPQELQAGRGGSATIDAERNRGAVNKFRLVGNRPLRPDSQNQKDLTPSKKSKLKPGSQPNPKSRQIPIPSFGGKGER